MSDKAPAASAQRWDKDVEVLIDPDQLQARIRELGAQITTDFQGKNICVVGILKGCFLFLADLVRQIPTEVEFDFICVASYGDGTSPGAVRFIKDLEQPIEGRDTLLVEDIIDTGHTIEYLKRNLLARKPASLRVCALLDKVTRRESPVHIDYVGFVLEKDKFIVGYGMDYAELYRNLPYIVKFDPDQAE